MRNISKLSKPFFSTLCVMGLLISSIAAGYAGRIGGRFATQTPSVSVQPEAHDYGVYPYPKAGQNEQQQARDKLECHQWAMRETGFDPDTAPTSGTPPQPPPGIAREAIGMVGTGQLAKGAGVGEGMGLATGNPYGAAIGAGRAIR